MILEVIVVIVLIVLILIILVIAAGKAGTCCSSDPNTLSTSTIANLTDEWINAVTVQHDPLAVANMFCHDASLLGTVSQIYRTEDDIEKYFDYFAKLPGITVLNKQYNISQVTPNVNINTAFITWNWDGLEEPVVARMSFVFRDNCIFQLHSSQLPALNQKLLSVSGKA